MIARIKQEITLWRVIVAIILVTGLYATYLRFFQGFRASTNLSDQMPWGLWVGLGTLCGVGLSAAGFGISAAASLMPSHPTLGDIDSPQALIEYQSAKRAHKAEWASMRAARPPAPRDRSES